jgi:acetyl-CoA carboxylase biotin carboxyl carrier protein
MAMKLDHDDLDRLIEKISISDIQEFSLEGEDFKLEIKRNLFGQSQLTNNLTTNSSMEKQIISSQAVPSENASLASNSEVSQVAPPGRSDLIDITSPMVGTFYRAAAPGDEPFVDLGNKINIGQTICILEAMKLMNEIESEFNAEIVEILVENGTPVEFGQVLIQTKENKRRKKYWEASIDKILKKSKNRIEPKCSHFGTCGGCKWQNMNYQSQLEFKQNEVINNLSKIGGITISKFHKIIGSKKIFNYRNKMEFTNSNTVQDLQDSILFILVLLMFLCNSIYTCARTT